MGQCIPAPQILLNINSLMKNHKVQRIQQEGLIAQCASETFSVLSTWLITQIKTRHTEIPLPFGFQLNHLSEVNGGHRGNGMTSAVKLINAQNGEIVVIGFKLSSVIKRVKKFSVLEKAIQVFAWKWWLTRYNMTRSFSHRILPAVILNMMLVHTFGYIRRVVLSTNWKPKSKSILRVYQTLSIFLHTLKMS